MDFFSGSFILWTLVAVALLLLAGGFLKKSWQAVSLSGLALLPPTLLLYTGDAGGWSRLPVLLPVLLFVLAYYMRKRTTRLF